MNSGLTLVVKSCIAATLLSLLAFVSGQSLAPEMSLLMLCLWVLGGLLALGLFLLVATLLSLTFRQWILRQGGTDTQWLWFASDPPGLQRPHKKPKP